MTNLPFWIIFINLPFCVFGREIGGVFADVLCLEAWLNNSKAQWTLILVHLSNEFVDLFSYLWKEFRFFKIGLVSDFVMLVYFLESREELQTHFSIFLAIIV